MAQRLYAVYRPIARQSVNAPLGLTFDIASGLVMSGLFVLLMAALPGGPITRGLIFGLIVWFFRVAMGVASEAVMFEVPIPALFYRLITGLVEMSILGLLYGAVLRH